MESHTHTHTHNAAGTDICSRVVSNLLPEHLIRPSGSICYTAGMPLFHVPATQMAILVRKHVSVFCTFLEFGGTKAHLMHPLMCGFDVKYFF